MNRLTVIASASAPGPAVGRRLAIDTSSSCPASTSVRIARHGCCTRSRARSWCAAAVNRSSAQASARSPSSTATASPCWLGVPGSRRRRHASWPPRRARSAGRAWSPSGRSDRRAPARRPGSAPARRRSGPPARSRPDRPGRRRPASPTRGTPAAAVCRRRRSRPAGRPPRPAAGRRRATPPAGRPARRSAWSPPPRAGSSRRNGLRPPGQCARPPERGRPPDRLTAMVTVRERLGRARSAFLAGVHAAAGRRGGGAALAGDPPARTDPARLRLRHLRRRRFTTRPDHQDHRADRRRDHPAAGRAPDRGRALGRRTAARHRLVRRGRRAEHPGAARGPAGRPARPSGSPTRRA